MSKRKGKPTVNEVWVVLFLGTILIGLLVAGSLVKQLILKNPISLGSIEHISACDTSAMMQQVEARLEAVPARTMRLSDATYQELVWNFEADEKVSNIETIILSGALAAYSETSPVILAEPSLADGNQEITSCAAVGLIFPTEVYVSETALTLLSSVTETRANAQIEVYQLTNTGWISRAYGNSMFMGKNWYRNDTYQLDNTATTDALIIMVKLHPGFVGHSVGLDELHLWARLPR